ncbi:MAG: hypothetical protein EZS28_048375 [Streblomastix strix]|uniref:Uncharacterized protein n=1 Tax=Streblomastix strix TaxID=222440 RepID=A0A5J4TD03_9EUKA|nr:MAG: hypothetical protein EZS28_048375 [Streblomastix strix]
MDLSFILVGDQDNEEEEEVFRLEEEVIYLVLGEDQGDYQKECYGMYQNGEDNGINIDLNSFGMVCQVYNVFDSDEEE